MAAPIDTDTNRGSAATAESQRLQEGQQRATEASAAFGEEKQNDLIDDCWPIELAKYKHKHRGTYFKVELEPIQSTIYEEEEMHMLQLKLSFMNPFSERYRIRGSAVKVTLEAVEQGKDPFIRRIKPEADLVQVSDQEITTGQRVTVGTSVNGGPSTFNLNLEGSKAKRTTFKGIQLIHGVIEDQLHASWKLYEEPNSKSGLPKVVRLLLVVQCKTEFKLKVELSARVRRISRFWRLRTVEAIETVHWPTVPDLESICNATVLRKSRQMQGLNNLLQRREDLLETFKMEVPPVEGKEELIQQGAKIEGRLQQWNRTLEACNSRNLKGLQEELAAEEDKREHEEKEAAKEKQRARIAEKKGRLSERKLDQQLAQLKEDEKEVEKEDKKDDKKEVIGRTGRSDESSVSTETPRYKFRVAPLARGTFLGIRGNHTESDFETFSPVGPAYNVAKMA